MSSQIVSCVFLFLAVTISLSKGGPFPRGGPVKRGGQKAVKSDMCAWFDDSPYACVDGSGICMREDDLCDGFKQCDDSSDEVGCGFGESDANGCTLPKQMGSTSEQNIMDQIVEAHNYFRCLHGVGGVTWDSALAGWASRIAGDNARHGYIHHSDGNGGEYGENIVMQPLKDQNQVTGYGMVKRWYDEIKDYNFNYGGFSGATGHFTQVVWKGSTKIGCGMATSPQGSFTSYWVVCNYKEPGNYEGQFEENVPGLI
ncbi:Golgi-associated plant pathogenesis-related protein 1-like isoform X2 [Glandiceps talaboti]